MFPGFMMHVGSWINMDQETDARNDQKKNTWKLVDLERERNSKAAHRDKIEVMCYMGIAIFYLQENPDAQGKWSKYNATANNTDQWFW